MFVRVVPFSRSFDEIGLIYFVPEYLEAKIQKGIMILIPFGKDIIEAIILEIVEKIDLDISKIKSIIDIGYEQPLLYDYQITLVKWISTHYFSLIHNTLTSFFPSNLRDKLKKNKLDLTKYNNYNYTFCNDKKLTKNQEKALKKILENTGKKILFHGVTGSGKTEIYVNLIQKYLKQNKQILLLVPEIILTSQVADYIKNVFGEDVIIINSSVSPAKKTKYWIDIHNSKAKIIVGTRSALFYPYKNLGLIIVDEEHDNSYISDSSPRINSVELVSKISDLLDVKILLASGTPNFLDMYKAMKGEYNLVSLFDEIS